MTKHNFSELISYCKGHHIYIQTHNFPDPDAIASAYGLGRLLEHYGIESTLCYVGKIDRVNTRKMTDLIGIKIYSFEELPREMTETDYIICVDSQKGSGNIKDLLGDEIACIDHHPLVENDSLYFQLVNIVGSCATIIAELFFEQNVPMDRTTATALMYGLKMDTLNFTRGVTERDIAVFAKLFPLADEEIIDDLLKNSMEFDDLKAYGAAIENVHVYSNIGFAAIPFACPDAQIAVVSDFILSLIEVEVSVVYSYRPDGIKFSVRSEVPEVNAGKLAATALNPADIGGSGGGHAFMAGGFLPYKEGQGRKNFPQERIEEIFLGAKY